MTITLQQYVTWVLPCLVLASALFVWGFSTLLIRYLSHRARSRVVDDHTKAP